MIDASRENSAASLPQGLHPQGQPPGVPQGLPRAWQRMLSGRRLDLLNPNPADIDIDDIAHGLARVARWNGQTTGEHAFSVAQHSLLVERIYRQLIETQSARVDLAAAPTVDASKMWCLAALLHDAPEYVVGDLISPFKAAIGYNYKAFELRLLGAVHRRFDLPEHLPDDVAGLIKRADGIAAHLEATALAGFSQAEADRIFGVPADSLEARLVEPLNALQSMPTPMAQAHFLARFRQLATTI
jgi:uncharacterized protein